MAGTNAGGRTAPSTRVVLLAGLKAVHYGVELVVFKLVMTGAKFIGTAVQKGAEGFLAKAKEEYASRCMGDPATLSERGCQQLEQMIQGLPDSPRWEWHLVQEYLILFSLAVGLMGGIAGLWATCGHNTLAAKLFWWSWFANFALDRIKWIVGRFMIEEQLYDHISMGESSSMMSPKSFMLMMYAGKYFFLAYFMKVSWSYYQLLRIRGAKKEPDFGGDVELRKISDESTHTFV